jgi:ABC-type spermidine/putrescine transport system permease subunit II
MAHSNELDIQITQEVLRRSQVSFDLAQSYYRLGFLSATATTVLGMVTAAMLLAGNVDQVTVSAATALPMAITTRILQEGGKRLEESHDRLREIERSHE